MLLGWGEPLGEGFCDVPGMSELLGLDASMALGGTHPSEGTGWEP